MPDTNPAPEGDQTNSQQDDEPNAAYRGLQRSIARKDSELQTFQTQLEGLRGEHDAAMAELETFRQRDAEANAEETARQTYEQLRARFEAEPPKPIGNNPARGWEDGSGQDYRNRERPGTGSGWPT